jgi:hypothetical protein
MMTLPAATLPAGGGTTLNVIFLSPHFPPNWYHFPVGLKRAGATVLGISDQHTAQLRPELRDALDDHVFVPDLHDYEALVRAVGWLIHRHGRIDRLDSLNEHWLEIEAALRTDFNIPGIRNEAIMLIKRKSLMKERFERAGLKPARGRVCRTRDELREFVDEVGFPVVAKPDIGVGAARMYKLQDEIDLERYLEEKPAIEYIVEEFVTGDIITYDGLVDRHGEVVFDSTLSYSMGVMDAVNLGTDIHYWLDRSIPDDVCAAGRSLVTAFDVRERPFHFEFFRTADGSLVPLEVNMRPPGGLTVDMMNWANDFDFYDLWGRVVVEGRSDVSVERPWCVLYAGRKNIRQYRLSHEEVMDRYGDLVLHHTGIEPAFAAALGDHGYVLRSAELQPLREAAVAIQEMPS